MKRKHPLHLSLIGILAAALLLGLGGCSVEETLPAPTPTPRAVGGDDGPAGVRPAHVGGQPPPPSQHR